MKNNALYLVEHSSKPGLFWSNELGGSFSPDLPHVYHYTSIAFAEEVAERVCGTVVEYELIPKRPEPEWYAIRNPEGLYYSTIACSWISLHPFDLGWKNQTEELALQLRERGEECEVVPVRVEVVE